MTWTSDNHRWEDYEWLSDRSVGGDRKNKFMSNIFRWSVKDVVGAAISAVLVAVIGYVLMVGDVFALDFRTVVNTGIMAGLGSLAKSFLTSSEGEFLGLVGVK